MMKYETLEHAVSWDELILFCMSTKCPIGNEDMDADFRGHRVFDVHGEAFMELFRKEFTKNGLTNFQRKASSLFEPDAIGCGYAITDNDGHFWPATVEDFSYIKQEIADWCMRHYWNEEVVA